MRILAFDQSTKITGYSIFDESQYVDSGVIDFSKNTNTEERSKQMGLAICNKIEEVKPDLVVIEEVAMQSNPKTLKLLARVQGIAIGFAAAHNVPLQILEPSKWRSVLGYKQGTKIKREELKQQSFDEQLKQEQARSQKLQQELSQLKSNIRQTPGVEDHEDDSPYPIYGEEEEEEEEEEEDEDVEA